MSEYNSALGYASNPTIQEIQDSLGIPQFSGTAGENWFIVLNGLIIQGGLVEISGAGAQPATSFNTAFTQQVLGIFLQGVGGAYGPYSVGTITLSTFVITNGAANTGSAYWWAIGV